MLSFSNTSPSGSSLPTGTGTAYVAGNSTGYFVFCPTARDLSLGGAHTITQESMRTASLCYQKGFSEHLRIQTSNGTPWFHRRICFIVKPLSVFHQSSNADSPAQPYNPYVATSNGMERLWFNQIVNSQPATVSGQYGQLFKGTQGQDWNDVILAPVDTGRVTLKFDKTWTIKSGNASGTVVERKLWHGMNKNLLFDDDQSGSGETTSYFSVDSKAGMGDYFIVDLFQAGLGGSTSDILNVYSNSTMYWHEK